jgi:hypothetical protein
MFNPIKALDVFRGPAVGEATEFGTTWHEAVKRINAFAVTIEARLNALEGKTAAPAIAAPVAPKPPAAGPAVLLRLLLVRLLRLVRLLLR